jgi:hypothetical protein
MGPPPDLPFPEPIDIWAKVDIEAAMPSLSDYPDGWTVDDSGDESDSGSADRSPYAMRWRVLELEKTTDAGIEWLTAISGWSPGRAFRNVLLSATREEAYGQVHQALHALRE